MSKAAGKGELVKGKRVKNVRIGRGAGFGYGDQDNRDWEQSSTAGGD